MPLSNPVNPPTVNEAVAKGVSTGLVFGVDENQTKINQLHGIAANNATGAGIPKQVTNPQVSIANANQGATCTVSILYKADPSDSSLSGVNVWVKGYQGNNNPVLVGSGTSSPTKIVLNNTGENVTFVIQAFGNGGNAPFTQAPTCSGTLPKSTGGGFGSASVVAITAVPAATLSAPSPLGWQRFYTVDNVTTPAREGPLNVNVNLTSNVSTLVLQAPGADVLLLKTTGGAGVQFQGMSDGDFGLGSGFTGIRWGNVISFSARVLPLPGTAVAGSDAIFYAGIATDNGDGTKTSIQTLTPNAAWVNSIASVGFYYRPSQSANWFLQTTDGAGNKTQTDSGVAVSTTLSVSLSFIFDGTTVTFFIGTTKVGTITGTLPASNTPMCNNYVYGNIGSVPTGTVCGAAFSYIGMSFR